MKLWVIVLTLHVPHPSPSTYVFHVLSKMKPVAKIKHVIATPLSKHNIPITCFNLVECWSGVPSQRRDRLSSVPGWPTMIHPTSTMCFTLGLHHAQMLTHRNPCWGWCLWSLGLAELYCFKTQVVPGKKEFKSIFFSWWRKSIQIIGELNCLLLCWLHWQHKTIWNPWLKTLT